MAWLGALALGAFGLLGAGRPEPPRADLAPLASPQLDLAQAPGMGCSIVRELHFETLPADAEPRVPPPRHSSVCLAVYAPSADAAY